MTSAFATGPWSAPGGRLTACGTRKWEKAERAAEGGRVQARAGHWVGNPIVPGADGQRRCSTAGPSAGADGKWCNHSVCIETYDTGTYLGRVEVSVTNTNQPNRISARVWTTKGWGADTKVEDVAKFRTYRDQVYPQRHFPAGTRLCAEGFRGGSSVGLPCVTLTD